MLDAALVETFEKDGAVAVPGLFDLEWIRLLRDAMPEILQRSYDPAERMGVTPGRTIQCDGMWRDSEVFRRFLFESPIGDVAAAVTRSRTVRLYEDLLLYRDAGADGSSSWHRDATYWPLTGRQLSSVWFSLEPVTRDTGGMRFVAGSHLDPDEVATAPQPDIDADPEQYPVISIEAEPGDAIVFHPRILHTAYGSAPDRPRRTFTIRFTGDDIRWRPRRAWFHPWMSDCGLQKGDALDHPGFPVVRGDTVAAAASRPA